MLVRSVGKHALFRKGALPRVHVIRPQFKIAALACEMIGTRHMQDSMQPPQFRMHSRSSRFPHVMFTFQE
jgi:hypothetical protein